MSPSVTVLAAAVLLSLAAPARAQLSNRAISLESGLSMPLERGERARAAMALRATTWLEGGFDGIARLAIEAARATSGRGADESVEGTAGVRWTPGPERLRPELFAELGWRREERGGAVAQRLAAAAGAGVEWFAGRDLSVAVRVAVRRGATGPELALTLGGGVYF